MNVKCMSSLDLIEMTIAVHMTTVLETKVVFGVGINGTIVNDTMNKVLLELS